MPSAPLPWAGKTGSSPAHRAGAAASAALYSLIETAKANDLEPLRYLHFLFEKLPLAKSQDDFRALLPQHLDSKTISA